MQIGPYRPDQPLTTATHAISNVHVRSNAAGGVFYSPQSSLLTLAASDALPEAPRGVGHALKEDGTYAVFVGTSEKLYLVSGGGGLTEIGTGYSLPTGETWSMAQFGTKMLFTNIVDGMLAYDVELGGAIDTVPDAPLSRSLFVWNNYVFALHCDGEPRLFQSSEIDDYTTWTGGSSQYQVIADGGDLMWGGALTNDVALLFQANQIMILTAIPTELVFSMDPAVIRIGCVNPRAGKIANGMAFFVAESGFWIFSADLSNIGEGKVNKTFIDTLVSGTGLKQAEVAVDPQNLRFVVAYTSDADTTESVRSGVMSYYWEVGEFVPATVSTSAMASISTAELTIGDVSDPIGSVDIPIGDAFWRGGQDRLAAFDEDYKLAFFTGPNMSAVLETPDMMFPVRQMVTSLSVNGDTPEQTTGVTVQVGVRDNRSDAIAWSAEAEIQPSGRAPIRGRGKMIRGRINIAEGVDWSEVTGFEDPEANAGGAR